MRLSDDRYTREREACELGLRLLRHQTRTALIQTCTGLSEDRIRKLYKSYFQRAANACSQRKRGKAPQEIGSFFRNTPAHLEASLLMGILRSMDLIDATHRRGTWRPSIHYVQRFCDAYEHYRDCIDYAEIDSDRIHEGAAQFSFEHAWMLMQGMAGGNLRASDCKQCTATYLRDPLAAARACPFCEQMSRPALTLVKRSGTPTHRI